MGKVLFIIAQDKFRDEELLEPKMEVENAGHEAVVASITAGECKGMLDATVTADLAVKDVNVDDYDVIVVVGGQGALDLLNYPEVLDIIKQAKIKDKNLAAICIAPMILAEAGVLQGKKATVYQTPNSMAALDEGGAEMISQDIVVDGKLVTASGPHVAMDFGRKIVEMLSN